MRNGGKICNGHILKKHKYISVCVHWPSRYVGVITNGWVGIINNECLVTHLLCVEGLKDAAGFHAVTYTITHHGDFSSHTFSNRH